MNINEISEQIRQAGAMATQKMPGGKGDQYTREDFDQDALAKGIAVEMEHTNDEAIAAEIAMDHLTEDPQYYEKLEKMEGVDKETFARFAAQPISLEEKQGTEIQTLIFDKEQFTPAQAGQWLADHDFTDGGVDETENSLRYRQQEPGNFESDSFRTIDLDTGIKAVIGRIA